jgi:hypothetical protein
VEKIITAIFCKVTIMGLSTTIHSSITIARSGPAAKSCTFFTLLVIKGRGKINTAD